MPNIIAGSFIKIDLRSLPALFFGIIGQIGLAEDFKMLNDGYYLSKMIALPDSLRRSIYDDQLMFHLTAICLSGPMDLPWQEIISWEMKVLNTERVSEYGSIWLVRVIVKINNDPEKPYVICIYLGMNFTFDPVFPKRFRGYKPNSNAPECFFTLTGNICHGDYGENYVQLIDWSARRFPPEYLKERVNNE